MRSSARTTTILEDQKFKTSQTMRINIPPSFESGAKRAMELRPKIIIFICFAALTTTPSSQITILSSQTTTPTAQSIIIYHGSPTIFPTDFICLMPCAPIIALNGLTVITIIPPTKFSAALPIIPSIIYAIYGIDLLLIIVLLSAPISIVVPTPASRFYEPTQVHHSFNNVLLQVHQLMVQHVLHLNMYQVVH